MVDSGQSIVNEWRMERAGMGWLESRIETALRYAEEYGEENAQIPDGYGCCEDCWKCDDCERLTEARDEGRAAGHENGQEEGHEEGVMEERGEWEDKETEWEEEEERLKDRIEELEDDVESAYKKGYDDNRLGRAYGGPA